MACPTKLDTRRIVSLEATESEASNVKSITFRDKLCSKANPGQYVMVWVIGVDEVPMSLSRIGPGDLCGLLVEKVGETTEAIHNLNVGQIFGLRGPFGNSFTLVRGRALLVAGGMGIAPLLPLAEQLKSNGAAVDFACGARTAAEFCGLRQARQVAEEGNMEIATDDGSLGAKGFVTSILPHILSVKGYDIVYCCGPELMIKEVFRLTEKYGLPLQASMERIIKCSVGLCGSCMIGKYRVCKDGLVLTSEQLSEVADEFGVYKRGFDGRRISFQMSS